jgi:hypothetical protein
VVPENATEAQVNQLHSELQAAQDRVRNFAEANVAKSKAEEFRKMRS